MRSEREIEEKLEEMQEEYEKQGSREYKGNVEALEWVLEYQASLY